MEKRNCNTTIISKDVVLFPKTYDKRLLTLEIRLTYCAVKSILIMATLFLLSYTTNTVSNSIKLRFQVLELELPAVKYFLIFDIIYILVH